METLFLNSGKWRLGKPLVSFKTKEGDENTSNGTISGVDSGISAPKVEIDLKATPYRRFWRFDQGNSVEQDAKGR